MKKILVLILFCNIGWGCSDDSKTTNPTLSMESFDFPLDLGNE